MGSSAGPAQRVPIIVARGGDWRKETRGQALIIGCLLKVVKPVSLRGNEAAAATDGGREGWQGVEAGGEGVELGGR